MTYDRPSSDKTIALRRTRGFQEGMNKDYSRGLIRNEAWRERRRKIIERTGCSKGMQSPLNDIQPPCHISRYSPCKIREKKEALK